MRFARLLTATACMLAVAGVAAPSTAASRISVAAPARTGGVSDIACPSATSCWAVGTGYGPNVGEEFLARLMHFDGKTWTTLAVAAPAGTKVNGHVRVVDPLAGVTCVSTVDCWAVGSWDLGDTGTPYNRALHWDGRHWSDVPVPTPKGIAADLKSVACVTNTSCWAVGTTHTSSGAYGQMLHWNGHVWRLVQPPAAELLTQVVCARGTCWASGNRLDGLSSDSAALLRLVHGTWVSVLPHLPDIQLTGAACPSLRSCWLSGFSEGGAALWHWDGAHVVPTAVPGQASFKGVVTCTTATSCWLSGRSDRTPRMYHWNGHTWKAFAPPDVEQGQIMRISCPSSTLCWAGGTQDSQHLPSIVLLRWNGKHWTRAL